MFTKEKTGKRLTAEPSLQIVTQPAHGLGLDFFWGQA
jgi:hypothetical protein